MKYVAAFLVVIAVSAWADEPTCMKNQYGEVVCGKGECGTDQYKKVFCARAGGGALKNSHGEVVCGIGRCAKDYLGQIWCSTEPGGGAAVDSYKKVKCLGGCKLASAELCEEAK